MSHTFWLLNTLDSTSGWMNLQDGGTAPTGANSSTGVKPGKTAVSSDAYWQILSGSIATNPGTTSFIGARSGPLAGSSSGSADSMRTPATLNGSTDGSSWTLNFKLRAGTAGAVGRINCRIWRSANANGSSATELTSGNLNGATVTLSTTADVNSSITWSPGVVTLTNEYLFFEVEWQETTTGTSASDNVLFRIGTAQILTPDFVTTTAWADSATLTPEALITVSEKQLEAVLVGLTPSAVIAPQEVQRMVGKAGLLASATIGVDALKWIGNVQPFPIATTFGANLQKALGLFVLAPVTTFGADTQKLIGPAAFTGIITTFGADIAKWIGPAAFSGIVTTFGANLLKAIGLVGFAAAATLGADATVPVHLYDLGTEAALPEADFTVDDTKHHQLMAIKI